MAATRHTSQRITLLMLVLASVTILTLDYHGEANRAITHVRNGVADVLAPLQRGVAAAVHPLGDIVSSTFHYGQLQSENERLQSELSAVTLQLKADHYAKDAEQQIEDLGHLPFAGNIMTVPAEVISAPTSNYELTVEINRGTSSGVGTGMPVVGGSGLVGSVIAASASTATVLLIDDVRTTIGVEDPKSGDLFQLQGQGSDRPLSLSPYGSASGSVSLGANLETAGQTDGAPASEYPAGIPVGRVSSVRTSSSGLQANGSVAPIADTNDLQYVAVLLWMPPA